MNNSVPLAPAVHSSVLQHELDHIPQLASYRGLVIYAFSANNAPTVMNEIGRLREQVFRSAGAGRNLPRDLDALDFSGNGYEQLVVWDPKRGELVALYRFKYGASALSDISVLRTSQLFNYSSRFIDDILPVAIELGRSVVNPAAGARRFGFFALWTGLQALLDSAANTRYFFGNVSLYKRIGEPALSAIIGFCQQHYAPPEPMLTPRQGLAFEPQPCSFEQSVSTPRQYIQALQAELAPLSMRIPKILQSYLSLSRDIYFDGAAWDQDFGDACELSIIVPVASIRADLTAKLSTRRSHLI